MKKHIFFLHLFILYFQYNFAQNDAFTSEITNSNDVIYYQNKPFTGTLYSDDEVEIPNNCQCTLKAIYTKGKLDGYKNEWYKNGNKKSEKNYKNGLAIGEHIYYNIDGSILNKETFSNGSISTQTSFFNNGQIKRLVNYKNGIKHGVTKEYDENGVLLKEIEYQKDKIARIVYYQNNKRDREEIFENNHIKKISFKNDKKLKEEVFVKDSEIKDGVWRFYDDNEHILSEIVYKNDKKIQFGNYINTKKEGEWITFLNDFKIKKIELYKNGNLIKTTEIKTENFLENYPFKKGDKVVEYTNILNNKTVYSIIRFISPDTNHNEYELISANIKRQLFQRAHMLNKDDYIGEKTLNHIIQITPIDLVYNKHKIERTKLVNGQQQKYYIPDYFMISHYDINITDTNNNTIYNFTLKIDSSQSFGNSFLANALNKGKTRQEAFNIALQNVHLGKLATVVFPIQAKISKIKSQTSSKIKVIVIDKGEINGVHKKMIFTVFDEENNEYKSKIKVIKFNASFSTGKVINEQAWLKKYIDSHTEVYLKEK